MFASAAFSVLAEDRGQQLYIARYVRPAQVAKHDAMTTLNGDTDAIATGVRQESSWHRSPSQVARNASNLNRALWRTMIAFPASDSERRGASSSAV